MSAVAVRPPHPVRFEVEYPERLSRLTTFFRLLLAIPQLIVVYLLFAALSILTVLAWFAILFTGRYPKGFFDFNSGVMRWGANVGAYAALFRDEYPPFSWAPGAYPLTLDIPYAERQSRWRLLVRLFSLIPNQIVFAFVQFAWFITSVVAWFAILFTGRYPRGLFDFGVGSLRWSLRQNSYAYLLRDEYPPYSISRDARPGNEVVSAVIGFPLFVGQLALYAVLSLGPLQGESETVLVQSPLTSPAFAAERPSGSANGVRVTILGYDDNALGPGGAPGLSGQRLISFRLLVEKDGRWPAFFTPALFFLHDCNGVDYPIEDVSSGFEFQMFWRGGSEEGEVIFEVPNAVRPCRLAYDIGFSKLDFRFLAEGARP